jgi:hypothetical protein
MCKKTARQSTKMKIELVIFTHQVWAKKIIVKIHFKSLYHVMKRHYFLRSHCFLQPGLYITKLFTPVISLSSL